MRVRVLQSIFGNSKAYLEPSRTSLIEFLEKIFKGKMFDWFLNTPLASGLIGFSHSFETTERD